LRETVAQFRRLPRFRHGSAAPGGVLRRVGSGHAIVAMVFALLADHADALCWYRELVAPIAGN